MSDPHLYTNEILFTVIAWGSVILLASSFVIILAIWIGELRNNRLW